MAEILAGASLLMGGMNYADSAAAKRSANKVNATADKWGPLLAANGSKGAGQVSAPPANLGASMIPSVLTAGMLMNKGSTAPGATTTSPSQSWLDTPSPAVAAAPGMAGGGRMPGYASGGIVPPHGYPLIHGAQMPTMAGMAPRPGIPQARMGAAMRPGQVRAFAGGGGLGGGLVGGAEVVPGDSPKNDVQPVIASSGEVILPKSVAQEGMKGNKWKVAAYLNEVKKHGPGPMPVKGAGAPQHGKPKSGNMSPWAAMCSGGMAR